MNIRLSRKVALITGSATGLGKRTAIELAKQGHHAVLNYVRSEQDAKNTASHIEENYGVKAIALQADIANPRDVNRLIQEALDKMGTVDILVHNAGPYIKEQKTFSNYSLDEWNAMINGNLNSCFYLLSELLPIMQEKGWGRIITLGFDKVGSAPGWKYRSAYAAAKSGVASLTRTLALEEAENGITINMVCPGDIVDPYKEMDIDDVKDIATEEPIGRKGTGEDIARTIAFLCEEKSGYITGSIIEVTGGQDILSKRNR